MQVIYKHKFYKNNKYIDELINIAYNIYNHCIALHKNIIIFITKKIDVYKNFLKVR